MAEKCGGCFDTVSVTNNLARGMSQLVGSPVFNPGSFRFSRNVTSVAVFVPRRVFSRFETILVGPAFKIWPKDVASGPNNRDTPLFAF